MKIHKIISVIAICLLAFVSANGQEKFVTVAKVKAPAVATVEFIKQGFVKAIPTYQKIEGLEFKAFSLQKVAESNVFGGIYLWKNKESAEKWFSPQWFSRVKTTYGTDGTVDYYEIVADKSFMATDFDYKTETAVTLFVRNLSEKNAKKYGSKFDGLLRSYIVKDANNFGAILLFTNEAAANKFVEKKKISNQEMFSTPVLLNNVK